MMKMGGGDDRVGAVEQCESGRQHLFDRHEQPEPLNVKNTFLKMMPMIEQVPVSLREISMRELAKKMESGGAEDQFDKIDVVLANL